MSAGDWLDVADVASVAPGRVLVVEVDEHDVALCNLDGTIFCVDDVCTHDGGALDQGTLDGSDIECPRHGARFDVRTGAVTQLPAFSPLAVHAVRVERNRILVAMEHA